MCRPGMIPKKCSPQRSTCHALDFGRGHAQAVGAKEKTKRWSSWSCSPGVPGFSSRSAWHVPTGGFTRLFTYPPRRGRQEKAERRRPKQRTRNRGRSSHTRPGRRLPAFEMTQDSMLLSSVAGQHRARVRRRPGVPQTLGASLPDQDNRRITRITGNRHNFDGGNRSLSAAFFDPQFLLTSFLPSSGSRKASCLHRSRRNRQYRRDA